MPIHDNINGVWHKVQKQYDNINGVQREVQNGYSNVNGVWRKEYKKIEELVLVDANGQHYEQLYNYTGNSAVTSHFDGHIVLSVKPRGGHPDDHAMTFTSDVINISEYSKISAQVDISVRCEDYPDTVYVCGILVNRRNISVEFQGLRYSKTYKGVIVADISNITGDYSVGLMAKSNVAARDISCYITKIWLE